MMTICLFADMTKFMKRNYDHGGSDITEASSVCALIMFWGLGRATGWSHF